MRDKSFSVPHPNGFGTLPPRCTARKALFGLHRAGNIISPAGRAREELADR
jgi:hypothetical protein